MPWNQVANLTVDTELAGKADTAVTDALDTRLATVEATLAGLPPSPQYTPNTGPNIDSSKWTPSRVITTTATGTIGRMVYVPYRFYPYNRQPMPVAGLQLIYITTAGSADSAIHAGIYGSNANGQPGNRLTEDVVFNTAAQSGLPLTVNLAASISLPPGLYWSGYVVTGTTSPACRTLNFTDLGYRQSCYDTRSGLAATPASAQIGNDTGVSYMAIGWG